MPCRSAYEFGPSAPSPRISRPLRRSGYFVRPPMAEAIAEVTRPRSHIGPVARSHRPAPALRAAGAFAPTGRAMAFRSSAETVLPRGSHRAGKTRCVFCSGPPMAEAIAEVMRYRSHIGPWAQSQRVSRPVIGWGTLAILSPPTMAEAIAEVMRHRFRICAGGPKPPGEPSAPPSAGASHPPGQALTSVILADPVLLPRSHRAGKTRRVFCPGPIGRGHRRGHVETAVSLGRVPQRHSASARPAIGGRFAPAGAGPGLWITC